MIAKQVMLLRYQSLNFLTCPKSNQNLFPSGSGSGSGRLSSYLSLLLRSTTTTTTVISSSSSGYGYGYGPSLQKGTPPQTQLTQFPDEDEDEDKSPFDEYQFTRVFEIAALRVPSYRCFQLESRLRGHLLNWPRISNIARVPGDDIHVDLQHLFMLSNNNINDDKDHLLFPSPVLYRDKLAKEFNATGFVMFRNLAKISRPNNNNKSSNNNNNNNNDNKSQNNSDEGEKGTSRKRRSIVVEVVEETDNLHHLTGLLGPEFKETNWRGSTRLLLLDETCAATNFDELPQAVKAVLSESSGEVTNSGYKLVRCNLTLLYEYWSSDEVLEALLPKDMVIPSAFETVGHIAHLNLKDEHLPYKKVIAKVVLDKNKPKIQTVVNKTEAISNDYRTMELEVLAGNHSLVTTVIENGLRFQVDLAKVYWNSRLSTERQRLLSCFTSDDVVCDVFSGVGPIAISAAKKVKRVYANDLNPNAVEYLERNCVLNKLERRIQVYNMDGRRFIEAIFSSDKAHSVTQVVMNLPNNAVDFLDAFRGIFRNRHKDRTLTMPMIHIYGFSRAEDPEFDFHERIQVAIEEAGVAVEMRRVRAVAPGKWMLYASFVLPRKVAFSKNFVDCT